MALPVREEVVLVLATLVALAVLVLGILEVVWPTQPRRRPALGARLEGGARVAGIEAPAAPVTRPAARLEALPPPIVRAARPMRSVVAVAEDRAETALRVWRALHERALTEPNPASDTRARLICRAIACLERGLEAAPDDARLKAALAEAHGVLAESDGRTAARLLATAMPWRAPEREWAAATSRAR